MFAYLPLCSSGFLRLALVSLVMFLIGSALRAQTIPPDKSSMEMGEGAGRDSYVELNGYPEPEHVLELGEQLKLSEIQRKDIQSIFDAMEENARSKGEEIITREKELERMFHSSAATEAQVKDLTTKIGVLRGELRAVHFIAHIQARGVLTDAQLKNYLTLPTGGHHHGPPR